MISHSCGKRLPIVDRGLTPHLRSCETDPSVAAFGDNWQKINCYFSFLWIGYSHLALSVIRLPWHVNGERRNNKCAFYWWKDRAIRLRSRQYCFHTEMLPNIEWNFVDSTHTSSFWVAFFSLPLLFYIPPFPTGLAYQSWRYTIFSTGFLCAIASLWNYYTLRSHFIGVWLIRLTDGRWIVCVKNWYWFTLTAVEAHRFKYDRMVLTMCEYLWDANWNNLLTVNGCSVFIISTDVFIQMRDLWWTVCIKGMWVFRKD